MMPMWKSKLTLYWFAISPIVEYSKLIGKVHKGTANSLCSTQNNRDDTAAHQPRNPGCRSHVETTAGFIQPMKPDVGRSVTVETVVLTVS